MPLPDQVASLMAAAQARTPAHTRPQLYTTSFQLIFTVVLDCFTMHSFLTRPLFRVEWTEASE